MINVDDKYHEAAKALSRHSECFVRIYGDKTSDYLSISVNNTASSMSRHKLQISNTKGYALMSAASCERGRCSLNGSQCAISEKGNDVEVGYVSDEICDENGNFSVEPTVTVTLNESCCFTEGVTIVFDSANNEYPEEFSLTLGDDTINYSGDDVKSLMYIPSHITNSTSTLSITITKWNVGNHRARVMEIYPGYLIEKNDIFGLDITQEISMSMQDLPYGELIVNIADENNMLDVLNPDGVAKLMKTNLPVDVYIGVSDVDYIGVYPIWTKVGSYYLSSVNSKSLTAELKALDTIGCLTNVDIDAFEESLSDHITKRNAREYLNELMSNTGKTINGVPSTNIIIPFNKDNVKKADCISTVIQALNLHLLVDENGDLHAVANIDQQKDLDISLEQSLEFPSYEISDTVGGCDVTVYNHKASSEKTVVSFNTFETSDIQKTTDGYYYQVIINLNEVYLPDSLYYGDEKLESFFDSLSDRQIEGGIKFETGISPYRIVMRAEGADAMDLSNFIVVTLVLFLVYGMGEGLVKGNIIETTTTTVSMDNPKSTNKAENRISVDNPCITSETQAMSLARRIIKESYTRVNVTSDWRGDASVQCGDYVSVENKYRTTHTGNVIKNEISFNGALRQKTTISTNVDVLEV